MLVYIKPLSIFPELHSETIFGALTFAIKQLYPEKLEEMIKEFETNPPFIISSPFPYIFNESEQVKFYPKISLKLDNAKEDYEIDDVKTYKKLKYVDEEIFHKIINGELEEVEILNNFKDYKVSNGFLMSREYDIPFKLSENIIPNNRVNRLSNQTEGIFYTSGREFKNMGLFFYIRFNDEEYVPIVKAALKYLKDRGFGRDVSVGKGQFDYEIVDEDIESNADGKFFVNLSRFIPNDNDLANIGEDSIYEIGSKRGRSSAGEIRKQIRFFKEGSLFPNYGDNYGKIVNVGKIDPAVEYGFAFAVKAKIDLGGV